MNNRPFEIVYIFPSGEKSSSGYFAETIEEAIKKFREVTTLPIMCIHEFDEGWNYLYSHRFNIHDDENKVVVKKFEKEHKSDNFTANSKRNKDKRSSNKNSKNDIDPISSFIGVVIIVGFIIFAFVHKDNRLENGVIAITNSMTYFAISEDAYGDLATFHSQNNKMALEVMAMNGKVGSIPRGTLVTVIDAYAGSGLSQIMLSDGLIVYVSRKQLDRYNGDSDKENNITNENDKDRDSEYNAYFGIGDKVKSIDNNLWVTKSPEIFEEVQILSFNRESYKLSQLEKEGTIILFPDDYAKVVSVEDEKEALGMLQVEINNERWYVDGSYLEIYIDSESKQDINNNTTNPSIKDDKNNDKKSNAKTIKSRESETVSISKLESSSRFKLSMKDDTNSDYNIYIYSDNEEKINSDGSIVYQGDYRIAIQKTGEDIGHLQKYKLDSFSFDTNLEPVYVLNGNDDILTISTLDESLGVKVMHFFIKNQKLTLVRNSVENNIYPKDSYKYLPSENFYQTAFHRHGIGGWYFINLKLDKINEEITKEEIVFEGYPSDEDEIGQEFLRRWNEDKNFILTDEMY